MEHIITEFISKWGYLAITILVLLENILPFIPSEIILTFAGLLSTKSDLSLPMLFVISTVASFVGLLVLYYISRLVSEERLYRFVDKYGKWIKLKGKDVARANDWFKRYGEVAVLVCRFVPVLRVLITIPAGINRMNVVKFVVLSLIGTTIWNFALIYLGSLLSDSWDVLMNGIHTYSYVMYVLLAVVIVYIIYRFVKRKRKS
ncbi:MULTISPECIES: undecaprenyl phosphate transporter UptA [Staphylococcus]|uniref:DedA family protein n=1 Tax=Staphylococcus pettenkoferi TaxID=170573 RepID=A0A1Z3U0Y1_9STAP|nr:MULTISPECIES: DedA family protein [Staphylococcus]ASE36919.1 DedA family protein [Staphylococcus pettenkoferi]EHM70892.1 SNARE-like domain protein [Staphylococcus pettenkoferi VCU012]MBX8993863.1 DedA family protein [Staphylococcus pettenkoferi]MCI2792170.1 DedA family protein [Staphylococcus pettenkoferi]MCY1567683.1 DedA family protein [Staphylococcus pettenkoferi]